MSRRPVVLSVFLRIVLVSIFIAPISCRAQNAVCPETIQVNQKLENAIPPWEVFQEGVPLQLMSVDFFEGHPNQRASLVPDMQSEKNGRLVGSWRFAPSKARKYWIGCTYDRTNITLTRPLGPEISTCKVTYDKLVNIAGHLAVIEVSCK
jgi:hypothetical protein